MQYSIKTITAAETWAVRHRVMWPNMPLEHVHLPKDPDGLHLGLFNEKGLVSVVSLFMTGSTAQFRKFATELSEQGKGYGTALLTHMLAILPERQVQVLWCNARKDKTAFYTKLGFVPTSIPFQKDGREYVKMEKILSRQP